MLASASDTSGNVGTASLVLAVTDPADSEPPVVALDSPAELEELTFLHDVTGTADDPNLLSWQLTLTRVNEAAGRTLAQDSVSVVSGTLAELDTTLLENGLYTLRLRAEDTNGQTAETSRAVRVDGGAKVGVVRLAFVDAVVPVAGIPIQVVRRYDSRDKGVGEFGHGWRLDLATGSLQHNQISLSGSGEGPGWATAPGYSTAGF